MCVKLTALGVISCRGELCVCVKLTATGVISCRGELDGCEIEVCWFLESALLSRRVFWATGECG